MSTGQKVKQRRKPDFEKPAIAETIAEASEHSSSLNLAKLKPSSSPRRAGIWIPWPVLIAASIVIAWAVLSGALFLGIAAGVFRADKLWVSLSERAAGQGEPNPSSLYSTHL